MKKQHIKEIICRAKRGKKIMEKLNRAAKCSISGPQNLGSGGGPGPPGPPPGSAAEVFYTIAKDRVSRPNIKEMILPTINS